MPNDSYDRRDFMKAAGASALAGAVSSVAPAAAATADELCFSSAVDLAKLIQTRQVSAREVMTAHLQRIERFNPRLNAIVAKLGDASARLKHDAWIDGARREHLKKYGEAP